MEFIDSLTNDVENEDENKCDENDNNHSENKNSKYYHLLSALESNQKYYQCLEQQLHALRTKLFLNLEKQRLIRAQKREELWLKYSRGRRCAQMRRQKFYDVPYFYCILKQNVSKGIEYECSEPLTNIDISIWKKKSKISINHTNKNDSFQKYVPAFHLNQNLTKIEKHIIITSARIDYIEKAKKI